MNSYKISFLVFFLGLFSGLVSSCSDDVAETLSGEVGIKSFMPLAVMENADFVISGTNLDKVTEIVFPDNAATTDFTLVTPNMIKLKVPAGVSGGRLIVKAANQAVESVQSMRVARPEIKSMEPGDEVSEREVITFKGEDLEFISRIVFPGEEETDITVDAMSFMRKSSGHLKVRVPVGILNGPASIRLIAADGTVLQSKEINLKAAAKDPDGSVKAYIRHIGSDRYLTRNSAEEYPRVMTYTGSKDQEFCFLSVEGVAGSYYIQNSATKEYLIIGDENDWRMFWVTDLTSIAIPERGMYQIVEIAGSDNIQIKNVGSGMLGTDSNDENSEVYGNKWGETEPRFLWRLDIISGSFDVPATGNVLWTGELEYGDWNILELETSLFADMKEGDKIRMHFIPEEGQYAQMDLRDSNDAGFPGFEWLGLGESEGFVDLLVTENVLSRISSGGLLIRGSHYTIVKVEIVSEPPIEVGNVLWEGNQEFGDWFVVTIPREYLVNLQSDSVIRMTFTPEEGQYAQMDLRDSNDVSFPGFEWLGLEAFSDGYVDFAMDESIRERIAGGGLLIRGSHYTLLKVEIL